jgi:Arc/MetJ-type ribon-helix-helix transcriptional regulator
MTADTEPDRMPKINVRFPEPLLTDLDHEWRQRGYTSQSAAVRDAVREWLDSPDGLGELLADIEDSYSVDAESASKKTE